MKKFDYMKSFKVLLAVALVIIVAGAFVLGFLNFNKDVKYTKHYEIVVQANDIGKAEETVKDTAEKVFRQEGVNPVYSESTNDNFEFTLVYLFRNDVSASVVESLQKEMDSAFQQTTVEVKVEKNYAEGYFAFTEMWWALLAAGILLVVAFFYAAIRYKWAAAFAFLITSVFGAALTLALTALVRVPVTPAYLAVLAAAFVFTMAMALYFMNTVKEDKKNVANADATAAQLAAGAFREVFLKNLVTLIAFLVFVVAMLILGTMAVKFVALQIVVAIVSAVFASSLRGGFYAGLRKSKK